MTRGQPHVLIIGAGFAGLAVAMELRRTGCATFTVVERGPDVGGVWRENTYPGAACDVPSPYYSYSYEPNPRWPRRFSPQPDILRYLQGIADKRRLRAHIRFGAEVAEAAWDDATQTWEVRLTSGETLHADVLVPAVGQLSRPSMPAIEGRETFAGESFHSAQWRHDVRLAGRRVAVIGTGASAIQFVPEIQPHVAHLDVFQRTAPYLLPRPDTTFRDVRHKIFERAPLALRAERSGWWAFTELVTVAFLYSRSLNMLLRRTSHRHMRRQVRDADVFERLWPDYPIGCKRILFSSDYLPAITRPNVSLVTTGIERIEPGGVRTVDGELHAADVIVYGTGFTATDFLAPMRIAGRDGVQLREQWAGGARAYLGLSVPNFPNLFVMYGPNTNLGSGSIVFMLECQARYVAQAVAHLAGTGAPLTVRDDVEADWDETVQDRLIDGVWAQCTSWYRLPNGRIPTNWPGTVTEYHARTATFRPADYEDASEDASERRQSTGS